VFVNCVGGKSLGVRLRVVDHSCCATHSAIGATARPQIGAVSDSRTANDPASRQLPSRCSKNHSRLRGCRAIQSSRDSGSSRHASEEQARRNKLVASYFFPILREISSKILGRKSARTLSTMLAMAAGSDWESAGSGVFSAPAATAMAAASCGVDGCSTSF
jgi:hypothetical protein